MTSLLGGLKRIDRLLITSFIPPMVLSFMIAVFVLTMQFFWLYIDEFTGKGIGLFQILELISYLLASFVPLALPMSVLLASVMVFGNLGERYELSSMKSAGISLLRIMLPLVWVAAFLAIISYTASNFLIPKTNLKFFTRLNDIRRQKPTLGLEEGIFNQDFSGYSIFIGKKYGDKGNIEDVIVYDESKASDLILVTRAKKGKMFTTDQGNRFVLELTDGEQVEEMPARYLEGGRRNYPLMRTKFNQYVKSFDLGEFSPAATEESRYSQNQKMLSNRLILIQIDTIRKTILDGQKKIGAGITRMFEKSLNYRDTTRLDSARVSFNNIPEVIPGKNPVNKPPVVKVSTEDRLSQLKADIAAMSLKMDSLDQDHMPDSSSGTLKLMPKTRAEMEIDLKPGVKVAHFYDLLDSTRRSKLFRETGTAANLVQSEIINVLFTLQSFRKKEILHWQQFYQKYTLALACIIFLFIGAPMGAIVRKGGFGYPLLIGIIFFIMYIMASKLFEKLTDSLVLQVDVGVWMTTALISLCGVYLTYRASKDVSSNFLDVLSEKIVRLFSKKKKKKNEQQASPPSNPI